VTITEIARRVGKSKQAVGAVLNGGRSGAVVGAATRARILATAERLGYRPNAAAKAVSTGRFDNVVLVQSEHDYLSWLPQELLAGLYRGLSAQGRNLTVAVFPDHELSAEYFVPRALREHHADGLLLNYTNHPPPALAALIDRHRIPAVWLNNRRPHDCARPDDDQAGALLAGHLLALGHRRVLYVDAFLGHAEKPHYSRVDRRAGCRRTLRAAGAQAFDLLPKQGGGDLTALIADALRRRCPTAVVAYSEIEAAATLVAAARIGVDVPRQLSVVSVNHTAVDLGLHLTIAVNPMAAVGSAAAEMLDAKIASPRRRLPPRLLPYHLLSGASCAPAIATKDRP